MQCQSPMSRGEFNGSRNVLTLLSVKMTERDMSPRASATRLSFHRLLRKGRASQAVAGWLATGPARHVTPLDVISFQHPGRTIFYQWINERSFSCNELGFLWAAHFVSFHKSAQSRHSVVALSYSLPLFSGGALLPPPELCSPALWWQSNIFVWETSSVSAFFFLKRCPPSHPHHPLRRAPFYLRLTAPLCSCSPRKHTHIPD